MKRSTVNTILNAILVSLLTLFALFVYNNISKVDVSFNVDYSPPVKTASVMEKWEKRTKNAVAPVQEKVVAYKKKPAQKKLVTQAPAQKKEATAYSQDIVEKSIDNFIGFCWNDTYGVAYMIYTDTVIDKGVVTFSGTGIETAPKYTFCNSIRDEYGNEKNTHTKNVEVKEKQTPENHIYLGLYPSWFADEMYSSTITSRYMLTLESVYKKTNNIRYNTYETQVTFFLDSGFNVIGSYVGDVSGDCNDISEICAVYADWSSIITYGKKINAVYAINVHNHPYSPKDVERYQCTPSPGDFTNQKDRSEYFTYYGIELYDDIVVSGDCLYSLTTHRSKPDGFRSVQWAWRNLGYTDGEVARTEGWLIGYCWTNDLYDGYYYGNDKSKTGYHIYNDTHFDGRYITYGGMKEFAAPYGTYCDYIEYINGA